MEKTIPLTAEQMEEQEKLTKQKVEKEENEKIKLDKTKQLEDACTNLENIVLENKKVKANEIVNANAPNNAKSTKLSKDALKALDKCKEKIAKILPLVTHTTKLPVYCTVGFEMHKYLNKLGELNARISKLESAMKSIKDESINSNDEGLYRRAEKHLRELKNRKKNLKKDGDVKLPSYGKDATTGKKRDVVAFVKQPNPSDQIDQQQ